MPGTTDYTALSNTPTIPSTLAALAGDATHRTVTDAQMTAWDAKDPGGAAAAVQGTLTTHAALTTTAHGGIVASSDARLSDARTPTAHTQAESTITFTDITTGNASAAAHGFLPKWPNNTTSFLRGDGTYAPPTAAAAPTAFTTLANDTLTLALAANINVKVTVTASRSVTTTVPASGTLCRVCVVTSGTSSFTITFSTGFKPVGTLATGTTSGRQFLLSFISDGTNLLEVSRTAAYAV